MKSLEKRKSDVIRLIDEKGILTITNVNNPERLLQYNMGSPRFVCYKGTQVNPTMYIINE